MNPYSARLDRLRADFDSLCAIRDGEHPGWTREAFSAADTEGRSRVAEAMRTAGLEVEVDALGNVIGQIDGTDPSLAPLVTGSHTDTVVGGGRFDGVVGVLGAIEAVRVLRERGKRLRHPLRVVDFSNEEPNAHGLSCVGSRAIAGTLTSDMLDLKDQDGRALGDRIRSAGWSPEDVGSCSWESPISAYVELHVEQGPVLEEIGASVGIVTSIAGIARFLVELIGRRDHAGTMPMKTRQDATCAAAESILAVERIASAGTNTVGTVGEVFTSPQAVNVVAECRSRS